jgi:hypothetical protein
VFVANVGRRKVIVKEVRFLAEGDHLSQGHVWAPATAARVYPVVLEPDEISATVAMPEALADDVDTDGFRMLLRDGAIVRCVVETMGRGGRERYWDFDVPTRPG